MRSLVVVALALTGCASVFDVDDSLEGRAARWAESAPHAELTCDPEQPGVQRCTTDPQNAAWLCGMMGVPAPACTVVLADARVMVVPRDDRTGAPDVAMLAHERCHLAGGDERACEKASRN